MHGIQKDLGNINKQEASSCVDLGLIEGIISGVGVLIIVPIIKFIPKRRTACMEKGESKIIITECPDHAVSSSTYGTVCKYVSS